MQRNAWNIAIIGPFFFSCFMANKTECFEFKTSDISFYKIDESCFIFYKKKNKRMKAKVIQPKYGVDIEIINKLI